MRGARMNPCRIFDVFNGDADGLLARHQFRLTYPVAPDQMTLISGVKRDIALLDRLVATGTVQADDLIQVFDISYDRNAAAVQLLLDAGARITYFDHHRASRLQAHPRLIATIDEGPDLCSSLLVDRHCAGAHREWAIAAAFGDNLSGVGGRLARDANLSPARADQLRQLGECLNYNSYGESVDDLFYHPVALAGRLQPYTNPFEFIEHEDIFARLKDGYENDLAKAMTVEALHASHALAVYLLPAQAWARRISGAFANHLVQAFPGRAHAVLSVSATGDGRTATVSIRAPQSAPRDAARVATHFANGGGRAIAAGIESFPLAQLPTLVSVLEQTYC